MKAALKPRSAQFLLERPAPGARGREWIDTDCVCEIAAEASARREPKVRRGIIVQRLQRDWIGVKATQLAQRKKKSNMTSFNTAWTRTRREREREELLFFLQEHVEGLR